MTKCYGTIVWFVLKPKLCDISGFNSFLEFVLEHRRPHLPQVVKSDVLFEITITVLKLVELENERDHFLGHGLSKGLA